MKTYKISAGIALLILLFVSGLQAQAKLEEVYKIQLKQLEETWNVLDQVTAKVWPDWKNYADVPFLFKYPNGVQMLVGHPNPPEGFIAAEGITVRDKKVYFDRRQEINLKMNLPVLGGGGPLSYGSFNNKSVLVVILTMNGAKDDGKKNALDNFALQSENQIMINLHELLHCYQRDVHKSMYGNLSYNTDANYSLYAEIEGLALEKAYFEKDSLKSKEFLKDFIIARDLKYNSMDEQERNEGAADEVREGGAVYAETMTLEALKQGYKPAITKSDDPFFCNFANIDSLFEEKVKMLRTARQNTMESYDKAYSVGAFQGLLLNRFVPGWQKGFYENGKRFDNILREYLKISDSEKQTIINRLKTNYDYDAISAKHSKLIKERDDTYYMIAGRKGISYIINFKNIFEHPVTEPLMKYSMGLIKLFPDGIRRIKTSDIEFTGANSPMVLDQLYYVKWIDTDSKSVKDGYKLTYSRKDGEDTFYDAVITTAGFTLKAPKVKLTERGNRLKITILSKIKV